MPNTSTPPLALALIQEAKEKKLKRLDLGKTGLREFPMEVLELVWLEELVLSNRVWDNIKNWWIESPNEGLDNWIPGIPKNIDKLSSLKILDLRGHYKYNYGIYNIEYLSGLKKLQFLRIQYANISDISFLRTLTNLQTLYLDHNLIDNIEPLKKLLDLKHLRLKSNQIFDITVLTSLNELEVLQLGTNSITNVVPLHSLTKLRNLDLSYNYINNISALRNLSNLKVLKLGGDKHFSKNNISNIYVLKNMIKLRILSLRGNEIKDISVLASLTHLQDLDLGENHIQDITHLKKLQNLQSLDIAKNEVKDISPLKNLIQLKDLNLSTNPIQDFSILVELVNLVTLHLQAKDINDYSFFQMLNEVRFQVFGIKQEKRFNFLSKLTNLKHLTIAGYRITNIGFLAELTNLKHLNLRSNYIKDITILAQLNKLQYLDISSNRIKNINGLENLVNLKFLYLGFNTIREVASLENLKKLSILSLSFNQISNIDFVKELVNLYSLSLNSNKIQDISSLEKLISITNINLQNNPISILPKTLKALQNLEELNVSNCGLNHIPSIFFDLPKLQRLDISNSDFLMSDIKNQIEIIPRQITNLKNLYSLSLKNNPIKDPPSEVAEKGIVAIRNYWKETELQGVDYIYEAKMLIIGEGGAGKTTLCQKILNPNYQLKPQADDISTEGIDIVPYNFPIANERDFSLNMWDFGGQAIYHSTHQFFLTKRSLYVLVTDNRKDDTDFRYWLNVQELLAGDSPVLIVQNEKQQRVKDINKMEIRGRFGNVKAFLTTNLKDNSGLADIVQQIKKEVQDLPHIGDKLPKSWITIRRALEQRTENYISLETYLEICQQHNMPERDRAMWLSEYLHDLGTILHFKDDPLLSRMVILKNEWGTDAVYKVLDSPIVKQNKGKFHFKNLPAIWNESKYEGKHLELITLMQKFKLCYQIPNKKTYIVPSRLPVEMPLYTWNHKDNLQLKYKYKFMPKGILTRFIVEMHDDIKDQKLVWKTGVVLQQQDTLAEVKEVYDEEEILIRVTGPQRMHLRSVVMNEIDKINKTFTNLKVEKLVLCPCPSCMNDTNPHFYQLKELQNYKKAGVDKIRCAKNPVNEVSVLELISDLYPYRNLYQREEESRDSYQRHSQNNPNIHVEVKPVFNTPPPLSPVSEPNEPADVEVISPSKPKKWYEHWAVISIIGGTIGGLILAYFFNKYFGLYFLDTWLASSSLIALFMVLRNPKNKWYRAAMVCIGLFSMLNLLPQLDILWNFTENMADGSWSKKFFQLGIKDSPVVSIALLGLAFGLSWLQWKNDREA